MDSQKANQILLRRKMKVIIDSETQKKDNEEYLCTIMKNLENLGFTFSQTLYEKLLTLNKESLFVFYQDLISELKELIGADVNYCPMYPNFPESIMEKEDAELYFNAILHYWTNGVLFPLEEKKERLPLFDVTEVKIIDLGSKEDLEKIFMNLCQSKTSISATDKNDLAWIFNNMNVKIPDEIPLKENVALIGKIYLECGGDYKDIQIHYQTATDVLRLITAMSNGDISLSERTEYRNFKRNERKVLLSLLNNCKNIEEDMLRYKMNWIRIGEKLHPGEYKRFDRALTAFTKIRNNAIINTFNKQIEEAFEKEEFEKALNILQTRPGELARKLDFLLRKTDNKNQIINTFKAVAKEVSAPVLLQVREHFLHRNEEQKARVFFPKGNLASSYTIENDLSQIDQKYCSAIVKICENSLVGIFQNRDFLGNVYVSEEFKNFIVPFNQRSASKALKTITRGSRIKLDENTKYLRSFIWWTNLNEMDEYWDTIDLDLSAAFFTEDWNMLEKVSYTHLKSRKFNSYHSGDIINGGPVDGIGVSEFLDVDIAAVLQSGGRYIVFQVYSYSEVPFCNMPHAMFGWMEREDVNSGEIYEPRTVKQKMDLASNSNVSIPVIFDCRTKEMIWCDMNLTIDGYGYYHGGNNIESNLKGVAATCYAMVNIKKPNLYDLIQLHIQARGLEVESKEDADVIFDLEDGITPYDTEIFMAEFL